MYIDFTLLGISFLQLHFSVVYKTEAIIWPLQCMRDTKVIKMNTNTRMGSLDSFSFSQTVVIKEIVKYLKRPLGMLSQTRLISQIWNFHHPL